MANLNETIVKGILRVYGKIKANEIYGNLIGNADSANKLAVARTISITGDATGSATTDFSYNTNINVSVNDDSHNHTFSTITGTTPVSKGGTGKTSIMMGNMLYASTNSYYSEVVTSSFGRSLLNASSGVAFTNLNADMVDGKHVDDSQTTTGYLWTANKIKTYADSLFASNDAMIFKGTIGSGGTVSAVPSSDYSAGWAYRVITNGIYAGIQCNYGDLVVCIKTYNTLYSDSDWVIIPSNLDGAVIGPVSSVNGNVASFDGASGKLIKDSGKSLPAGNLVGDTSYGTEAVGGTVKSSSSFNQVSIDPATGVMTLNTVTPIKGGTGKTSVAQDSMLYASEADVYSEVSTTSFGRSLLNALPDTIFASLNSDMVDGKHVDDAQTTTGYLWTAAKIMAFVNSSMASKDTIVFKGTVGTGGSSPSIPTTGYVSGEAYKVISAGTYINQQCQVGDLIICVKDYLTEYADSDWSVIHTNSDGNIIGPTVSIDNNIAVFDGSTGKLIKDSGKSLPAGNLVGDTSYGTSSVGGVVKSSTANNQVSIHSTGVMIVNMLDTSKLAGYVPVAKGGTGKPIIKANTMIYASTTSSYSEVDTTTFGRSLLNTTSGTKIVGLNADTVDGLHTNDSTTGMGSVWGFIPKVHTDGIMEIGKNIDFHEVNGDTTTDYTYRLTALASGLEGSNRFSAPVLRGTQKVNIGDAFDLVYNSNTKSLDIISLLS